MGSFSLVHWIIVLGIIVLLFGAGRLSHVMGDFAKGIKAFKAGLKDEDEPGEEPAGKVPPPNPAVASGTSTSTADHPSGRA